jgi:hypothetical protein
MRKLLLAACLCVLAFVIAPIASANAEGVKGTCTVSGTTHFWGLNAKGEEIPLNLTNEAMKIDFLFEGKGKCVELPSGEVVDVDAHVEGSGEFSCVGKGEGTAKGSLTVLSGPKKGTLYKFGLDLEAVGGNVVLKILNEAKEETAKGTANFYISTGELAAKCAMGGVKELEFNAVAAGEIG